MPRSGVPVQQATPKPTRAMPHRRATVTAMPVSCTSNSNSPTSDGTISNAAPVAASTIAANRRAIFIALLLLIHGMYHQWIGYPFQKSFSDHWTEPSTSEDGSQWTVSFTIGRQLLLAAIA